MSDPMGRSTLPSVPPNMNRSKPAPTNTASTMNANMTAHVLRRFERCCSRKFMPALPIRRFVVLQKLSPHVPAGVDAVDDGIDDAGAAVDGVERRMEAHLLALAHR